MADEQAKRGLLKDNIEMQIKKEQSRG